MTKKILMKKGDQKLMAQVVNESSKQRVGVMLYQVNKAGEVSIPTTVQRADLLKKSKTLQDLLNLSICLTEEELDAVIEKATAMLESPDQVGEAENIDAQATPRQLYKAICGHGKEVVAELILNKEDEEPKWQIWLDKEYLCIRTSDFGDFLKEIPEADEYKKTDILRSLKLLGVLDTDSGRAYDKKISKDGQKINCYRIQMPAEKSKKAKAEEVIQAEVTEEPPIVETKSKPTEASEGVQMTVEEILKETESSPSDQKPTSEKEKLLAGLKEMLAEESAIKLDPAIPEEPKQQPEPVGSEEDWGGFSF